MICERAYKNITWYDLNSPTEDEIKNLIEKTGISLSVANELRKPSVRSKASYFTDHIYLILHFPGAFNYDEDPIRVHTNVEVDVVIGEQYIITTHYDQVDVLHEFSKQFEAISILDSDSEKNLHGGSSYIFYLLIHHLYRTLYDKVIDSRDALMEVEEQIFSGNERKMVYDLSRFNRVLLGIEESLSFHKEVLTSYTDYAKEMFHSSFGAHLRSVMHEYEKVANAIHHNRRYLDELRLTNDSLLSSKQNEIMKDLAVLAAIFLPLGFVTSVFGMNTVYMPFAVFEKDFLVIIALMALLSLMTFIVFKLKRWI